MMTNVTNALRVLPLLVAFAAGSAQAGKAPDPVRSAYCVAALKTRAEPMAKRVQAGDAAAEAQLFPVVTASFAFIGTAYKQGVGSEQAEQMLKQAEKLQADMAPTELAKLQDVCQAEGQTLYREANVIERQFVKRAANARIEKLRRKPA